MSSPAPPPPAANQNTPTFGQGIAAFIVACIVLAGLFAAALSGILPPNLAARVITLCIAVAGSGFTMFLLGSMSWDLPNGLKIGGKKVNWMEVMIHLLWFVELIYKDYLIY